MTTTPASRRADSIRLGPWHQGAVYGATAALALSGIIWLCCIFFAGPLEYGPADPSAGTRMRLLHGASAWRG